MEPLETHFLYCGWNGGCWATRSQGAELARGYPGPWAVKHVLQVLPSLGPVASALEYLLSLVYAVGRAMCTKHVQALCQIPKCEGIENAEILWGL